MPERPIRPSNVHYYTLRMVELMALVRECGLQGYSRLGKAQLISLLWKNESMPEPEPISIAQPPKPIRPPPTPPESSVAMPSVHSLIPYELERAFRGSY